MLRRGGTAGFSKTTTRDAVHVILCSELGANLSKTYAELRKLARKMSGRQVPPQSMTRRCQAAGFPVRPFQLLNRNAVA